MVQLRDAAEAGPSNEIPKAMKAREANWPAVLFYIHIHLLSLYGLWLVFFEAKLLTVIFLIAITSFGVLGVTTGAHRLWAHNTYKATTSLRIFLMFCQTLAGQGSIYDWVRQHRLHHAHFGTDGDPFDHNRGFLHAHALSRMRKLSSHQTKLLNEIDMKDLDSDPVVVWQNRLYWLLYGVFFLLLPLNAPLEYWDDSITNTLFIIGFLRYAILLHSSWLVESGISVFGLQAGEKYPHDSNSVFFLAKNFWPHYHYLVPYDYKSGEFGTYDCGCSTAFIRVWAALGLATELRTVTTPAIQKAMAVSAKTKRPLKDCINEVAAAQLIPEDHYLRRG